MKIAIASDHAGFSLKEHLKAFLKQRDIEILDLGAFDSKPSDYPAFAARIGKAVVRKKAERGVLICGSGVGASIAANKIDGVRAAICHDGYSARQGVEHDDMNILVLGSRVIGTALAETLVEEFLNAVFSNEPRHVHRLKMILKLEKRR